MLNGTHGGWTHLAPVKYRENDIKWSKLMWWMEPCLQDKVVNMLCHYLSRPRPCDTTCHSICSFSQSTHNWHKSHNTPWSDWISELYDTTEGELMMHWGAIGLEANLGRILMVTGRLCLMSTALPINNIFCQLPMRVYCCAYEMQSNLVLNCPMLSSLDIGGLFLTTVINDSMAEASRC